MKKLVMTVFVLVLFAATTSYADTAPQPLCKSGAALAACPPGQQSNLSVASPVWGNSNQSVAFGQNTNQSVAAPRNNNQSVATPVNNSGSVAYGRNSTSTSQSVAYTGNSNATSGSVAFGSGSSQSVVR